MFALDGGVCAVLGTRGASRDAPATMGKMRFATRGHIDHIGGSHNNSLFVDLRFFVVNRALDLSLPQRGREAHEAEEG